MRKKSKLTLKEIDAMMTVMIEAMKVWPENAAEYRNTLSLLHGMRGRYKRARKRYVAKSYNKGK